MSGLEPSLGDNTAPPQPSTFMRSHPLWRFAMIVVSAASLAWVLWLLADVWPQLAAQRGRLQMSWLLEGFVLSALASGVSGAAFVVLAPLFGVHGLRRIELAHFYFSGQVLKHLPGRVWGIGYQWASSPAAIGGFRGWLLANVMHLLLGMFFVLWCAASVLAFARALPLGAVAVAVGLALYAAGWSIVRFATQHSWPSWLSERVSALRDGMNDALRVATPALRARVFALFLVSSACFYLSWYCYGESWPLLGGSAGVRMCAYYLIAWLIGYLSLLTPSGLGVRELAFAWLAQDFPGDSIAYMAAIGRGSLLGVDLLLGVAFLPFAPRRR